MKRVLLSILCLGMYCYSFAQLKLAENFASMSAGNLGIQNTWVQNGSGTDVQVIVLANNTGALTYPGYTSGQNYISVAKTNGIDPHKLFNVSVSTAAASTFYTSFVVRVPSAANVATTTNAEYSVTLRNTSNTAYLSRFYIGKDASNNIEFGTSADAGTRGWSNGNYATNTTYLIVMRYDVVPGNNNDDVWIWVNPSLSSEPSTATAQASQLNAEVNYGAAVNSLMIHQRDATDSPVAQFDAFRVSNGATSAEAWANLGAVGGPLPVKFSNLKATQTSRGINLQWSNMTESDVVDYTLERSSNGRNFTSVAQFNPSANNGGKADYQYMDASPLSGTSFYRIKAVETNGKTTYSDLARISIGGRNTLLNLYPNPVKGNALGLQIDNLPAGKYSIRIYNGSAQAVTNQSLNHEGGSVSQTIPLNNLKAGVYTFEISGVIKLQKQFIIE